MTESTFDPVAQSVDPNDPNTYPDDAPSEEQIDAAQKPKEERISRYVVYAATGIEFKDEDEANEALEKAAWHRVATVAVKGNGGQREARSKALEADSNLRGRVESGEVVWFVCVPQSSHHPHPVFLKTRDPELHL